MDKVLEEPDNLFRTSRALQRTPPDRKRKHSPTATLNFDNVDNELDLSEELVDRIEKTMKVSTSDKRGKAKDISRLLLIGFSQNFY